MMIPALVEIDEIVSMALKQFPSETDKAFEYATRNISALSSEQGYELLNLDNYSYNVERYVESRIFV